MYPAKEVFKPVRRSQIPADVPPIRLHSEENEASQNQNDKPCIKMGHQNQSENNHRHGRKQCGQKQITGEQQTEKINNDSHQNQHRA
jgi:hypothetical protein